LSGSPAQPPTICFVALQAYNVLSGDPRITHIGGAEMQQTILARGLARRGYGVSLVTLDHGQTDGEVHGGLQVFKSYHRDAGLPGLRFVHPRITRVWAAMRRAHADVYYQRTSDSTTGLVAAFCRRYRRRFIYAVAAMADCDPELPNCRSRRERWLYLYGLRHADAVVAQTTDQQKRLWQYFERESTLIRSTALQAPPGGVVPPAASGRPEFLWVGRWCREKRPELLVELARQCPEVDIEGLGVSAETSELYRPYGADGLPSNLHLYGYVPHEQVGSYYDRATALISTSRVEGFPNTFLEAWSRGLPVVSTVDPDGLIQRKGLGWYVSGMTDMAQRLRTLRREALDWVRASERCRAHFSEEHTLDRVLDQYEALIRTLVIR